MQQVRHKDRHKPGSVLAEARAIICLGWPLLTTSSGTPQPWLPKIQQSGKREEHQSCCCGLASHRGLPSQSLTTLLVGSYPTIAPLPVLVAQPSAVCFCGTILTVARTGLSPAVCSSGSPDFPHCNTVRSPRCLHVSPPILSTGATIRS